MLDTQMPTETFVPSVSVVVTTTDLSSGKSTTKIIDHNNHEDRVWLGRHAFWAMRNNHSVETRPA